MDRILTLLLAFLITLAPIAPAEAGGQYVHAMPRAGASDQPARDHGTQPNADAPAMECSITGGHCVLALTPDKGIFAVGFSVAFHSAVHGTEPGQGIVLTAEPPPPRA